MSGDKQEEQERQDEHVGDVLLALLVFDVENKGEWMSSDVLKLKTPSIGDEQFEDIVHFLKEKKYIEVKEEESFSYMQITKNGRAYLMEKV